MSSVSHIEQDQEMVREPKGTVGPFVPGRMIRPSSISVDPRSGIHSLVGDPFVQPKIQE